MGVADHGHAGEVEAAERLARRQPGFQQVPLDASLGSLGEFEFGEGCQQACGGPALAVSAFGKRQPQFGDGG